MKALIVLVVLIVGWPFYHIYRSTSVVDAYSVQENISNTPTSHSWEMWCHYDHPDGSVTKKLIAKFAFNGDPLTTEPRSLGQLTTDLCRK